ncbi:FkbM family methyltransferase [Rhizobium sp. FY34]|uniref:FkbM family methyltransferase n=1 Tax=Rhizobium sp. FY34 TaxID=2562309 RepID=UPI0014856150|nr:FkbM family methyltransferase [Rhizobium sp. FY34]
MNSYSQNFEDVLLRRALQDIERGFYVDVGAFDPDNHSVTKYFYDQGWSGINLEPHPVFYKRLCESRDRDINLNIAVSDFNGTGQFQLVEHTGMSSLNDDFSDFVRSNWEVIPTVTPVSTLDVLIREYAPDKTIDFLKIDVEGHETAVLLGANLRIHRPRIIVVEAVRPFLQEPTWLDWEPEILAAGYHFAWFDGLNRFYVREEDSERLAYFRVPPCCFDSFSIIEHQWGHLETAKPSQPAQEATPSPSGDAPSQQGSGTLFSIQHDARAVFRYLIGRWPSEDEVLQLVGSDPTTAPSVERVLQQIISTREYEVHNATSLSNRKLFFFQLPNSGGTSIANAIRSASNHLLIAPYFGRNTDQYKLIKENLSEFKGYNIYFGHISRDIFNAVETGHEYLINFRHPVARAFSLYNFFRNDERLAARDDPMSQMNMFCAEAARSLSFADFVASEHPNIRTWISDFQFKQLTSNPWSPDQPSGHLDDVFGFVKKALGLFVCEFSEISSRRLCSTLNLPAIPFDNTSYDKPNSVSESEIRDETIDLILSLNQRDLKIYQFAVDQVLS